MDFEISNEDLFKAETVTPHKVTVTLLLITYFNWLRSDEFKNLSTEKQAELRRNFCIVLVRLLQGSDLEFLELKQLLQQHSSSLCDSLVPMLEECLSKIVVNGIGHFLNIFDKELAEIVVDTSSSIGNSQISIGFNQRSITGFYMRRLKLKLDQLNFEEVVKIFESTKEYYQQYVKTISATNFTEDFNLIQKFDSHTQVKWSVRQAKLFLSHQVELLNTHDPQALSPVKLNKILKQIISSNGDIAETHFLMYCNYLRTYELCGAIRSLYHCFDKSTIWNTTIDRDDRSKIYRYAALNLAILYYYFGFKDEAVISLKESIKMSQTYNDNSCLQQALAWLFSASEVSNYRLVEHSVSGSFKLNLPYSTSFGIQNFVQYASCLPGNPLPVFQTLTKSDLLNYKNNMHDLMSANLAVKSALWQFYGKRNMTALWSQQALYRNTSNLLSDIPNSPKMDESYCTAIANMCNLLCLEGDYQLANAILCHMTPGADDVQYASSANLIFSANFNKFWQSLCRQEWTEAHRSAQFMTLHNHLEGYLASIDILIARGQFLEAQQSITSLNIFLCQDEIRSQYNRNDIEARLFLKNVQLHLSSCPDVMPCDVITALPRLENACRLYHMDHINNMARMCTVILLLRIGMNDQALHVLNQCIIHVLAHGSSLDRAQVLLLYVECLLTTSKGYDHHEKGSRIGAILRICALLEDIKKELHKIQMFSKSADIMFLQAHLYNSIEMTKERNKCALEFRKCSLEYGSHISGNVTKFLHL